MRGGSRQIPGTKRRRKHKVSASRGGVGCCLQVSSGVRCFKGAPAAPVAGCIALPFSETHRRDLRFPFSNTPLWPCQLKSLSMRRLRVRLRLLVRGGCQKAFGQIGQHDEICTDVSLRRKPTAQQPAMNTRKVHKEKRGARDNHHCCKREQQSHRHLRWAAQLSFRKSR